MFFDTTARVRLFSRAPQFVSEAVKKSLERLKTLYMPL